MSISVLWLSLWVMVTGLGLLVVTMGFHIAGMKPVWWPIAVERQRTLARRRKIASVTVWPAMIFMVGGYGLFSVRAYHIIVSGGGL